MTSMVFVGGVALVFLTFLSDWYFPSLLTLSLIVFIVFLASILSTLIRVFIGFLAFWLQEIETLHFLNNKILFVLGGLLIPLPLYPLWLQNIAYCTPYPAMLYGPASLVYNVSIGHVIFTISSLILWIGIVFLALSWVYQKGRYKLEINGG